MIYLIIHSLIYSYTYSTAQLQGTEQVHACCMRVAHESLASRIQVQCKHGIGLSLTGTT